MKSLHIRLRHEAAIRGRPSLHSERVELRVVRGFQGDLFLRAGLRRRQLDRGVVAFEAGQDRPRPIEDAWRPAGLHVARF